MCAATARRRRPRRVDRKARARREPRDGQGTQQIAGPFARHADLPQRPCPDPHLRVWSARPHRSALESELGLSFRRRMRRSRGHRGGRRASRFRSGLCGSRGPSRGRGRVTRGVTAMRIVGDDRNAGVAGPDDGRGNDRRSGEPVLRDLHRTVTDPRTRRFDRTHDHRPRGLHLGSRIVGRGRGARDLGWCASPRAGSPAPAHRRRGFARGSGRRCHRRRRGPRQASPRRPRGAGGVLRPFRAYHSACCPAGSANGREGSSSGHSAPIAGSGSPTGNSPSLPSSAIPTGHSSTLPSSASSGSAARHSAIPPSSVPAPPRYSSSE